MATIESPPVADSRLETRAVQHVPSLAPGRAARLFAVPVRAAPNRRGPAVLEPGTDTHPGVIGVTFENVTDERSLLASMRGWPFGSYVGLGPEGRRLVLLPAETFAPGFLNRTEAGWWEPDFLPHESVARGRSTTASDPGETRTARYIVTSHPETDDPRDGDGFAFEQGFSDDDVDVTWGFTLTTLDPE
ncbi:hypothetical protein [Halovivax limisalsi]|uniref:hypothetical protein n=1 Tax=Halovivax limisalsi TaxID=1453760 RepID=UPI001FFD7B21|nr:hypothetical protein [Halovivax limisalsi]